jgi:hypothetical protein
VVTERFTRDFGFGKPADAVGQTIELLAPSEENKQPTAKKEEEEPPNFFGIPLEDEGLDESKLNGIETHRFKITGVLGEIKEGVGQGGLRGLDAGRRCLCSFSGGARFGGKAARRDGSGCVVVGSNERDPW